MAERSKAEDMAALIPNVTTEIEPNMFLNSYETHKSKMRK